MYAAYAGTRHESFIFLPLASGIIVGITLEMETFPGNAPSRENITFGGSTVIDCGSGSVVFVTGAVFLKSLVPNTFDPDI
jgi:hypothetical protein